MSLPETKAALDDVSRRLSELQQRFAAMGSACEEASRLATATFGDSGGLDEASAGLVKAREHCSGGALVAGRGGKAADDYNSQI